MRLHRCHNCGHPVDNMGIRVRFLWHWRYYCSCCWMPYPEGVLRAEKTCSQVARITRTDRWGSPRPLDSSMLRRRTD